MQKASSQLQASLEPSLKQLGALKEIQTANEIQQGGYIIVQVPVLFENQNLCVNVVFDDQDQIAGVNFSEYVEPSNVAALTLPEGAAEQELTLTMRDGKDLPATLTLPQGDQPAPVIILVHGSGPNDRNETLYGNTVFQDIAYRLARASRPPAMTNGPLFMALNAPGTHSLQWNRKRFRTLRISSV